MLERRVQVINDLGLHARAAAQLVRLAATFTSDIRLYRNDTGLSANAKSILSVLHLAAASGTEVRVTADGEDEGAAIEAIARLFEKGFGELTKGC